MKLVLAPMATLSHEALRLLIHRYGDPDEYFSEMIHAPSFVGEGRFEHWYVRTAPAPEKMVWHLTGSTAGPMAKAAGMLQAIGGIGVDLNMGCSAPDIARCGAGIAWMIKPPAEAASLVAQVRAVLDGRAELDRRAADTLAACDFGAGEPAPGPPRETPFRLSVKMRLGEDEDYPRLLSFCRMLVDEGVELITLHPRVRRDKYGRPARREYVSRLASDLSVPVYGNGDVDSPEDAHAYLAAHPCAGLMIGRAAVQKPWLFAAIRARTGEITPTGESSPACNQLPPAGEITPTGKIDHFEVASFFLANLKICQPPEFQLSRAHRFFFYYCDNFSFAHHIKMRIQNVKTPDDIGGLLEAYFEQVPGDRFLG